MVVEVIAGEVGEGGGGDTHAVEAVLVEAVARRLHRQMVDADGGQVAERPVQGHRVGRGQAAGPLDPRAEDPERAHRSGGMALGCPDLAQEPDDGGLAVGAGDGGDGLRLLRIEARRQQGEAAARVVVVDQGQGHRDTRLRRQHGAGRRQHRHGAAPHRIGDEVAAVGAGAGKGGKQEAGLHLPRVGGEPGDPDS